MVTSANDGNICLEAQDLIKQNVEICSKSNRREKDKELYASKGMS